MWINLFNAMYVLVVVSMVALILMQQGQGANAGSGFGGGASATVFGARGSTNFITKATWVLAVLFLAMSLAMGVYIAKRNKNAQADDLGVMGAAVTEPAKPVKVEGAAAEIPQVAAPVSEVPAATAPATVVPANEVPAAAPATDGGKSE